MKRPGSPMERQQQQPWSERRCEFSPQSAMYGLRVDPSIFAMSGPRPNAAGAYSAAAKSGRRPLSQAREADSANEYSAVTYKWAAALSALSASPAPPSTDSDSLSVRSCSRKLPDLVRSTPGGSSGDSGSVGSSPGSRPQFSASPERSSEKFAISPNPGDPLPPLPAEASRVGANRLCSPSTAAAPQPPTTASALQFHREAALQFLGSVGPAPPQPLRAAALDVHPALVRRSLGALPAPQAGAAARLAVPGAAGTELKPGGRAGAQHSVPQRPRLPRGEGWARPAASDGLESITASETASDRENVQPPRGPAGRSGRLDGAVVSGPLSAHFAGPRKDDYFCGGRGNSAGRAEGCATRDAREGDVETAWGRTAAAGRRRSKIASTLNSLDRPAAQRQEGIPPVSGSPALSPGANSASCSTSPPHPRGAAGSAPDSSPSSLSHDAAFVAYRRDAAAPPPPQCPAAEIQHLRDLVRRYASAVLDASGPSTPEGGVFACSKQSLNLADSAGQAASPVAKSASELETQDGSGSTESAQATAVKGETEGYESKKAQSPANEEGAAADKSELCLCETRGAGQDAVTRAARRPAPLPRRHSRSASRRRQARRSRSRSRTARNPLPACPPPDVPKPRARERCAGVHVAGSCANLEAPTAHPLTEVQCHAGPWLVIAQAAAPLASLRGTNAAEPADDKFRITLTREAGGGERRTEAVVDAHRWRRLTQAPASDIRRLASTLGRLGAATLAATQVLRVATTPFWPSDWPAAAYYKLAAAGASAAALAPATAEFARRGLWNLSPPTAVWEEFWLALSGALECAGKGSAPQPPSVLPRWTVCVSAACAPVLAGAATLGAAGAPAAAAGCAVGLAALAQLALELWLARDAASAYARTLAHAVVAAALAESTGHFFVREVRRPEGRHRPETPFSENRVEGGATPAISLVTSPRGHNGRDSHDAGRRRFV